MFDDRRKMALFLVWDCYQRCSFFFHLSVRLFTRGVADGDAILALVEWRYVLYGLSCVMKSLRVAMLLVMQKLVSLFLFWGLGCTLSRIPTYWVLQWNKTNFSNWQWNPGNEMPILYLFWEFLKFFLFAQSLCTAFLYAVLHKAAMLRY